MASAANIAQWADRSGRVCRRQRPVFDAAHLRGAGKGHLVDALMTADGGTRSAIALNDVDHTGRKADLVADLCKLAKHPYALKVGGCWVQSPMGTSP